SSSLNLPNSALQNSSLTINGTLFNLGDNKTITAASSTLLANANTFSGSNTFTQTINGSISGNAGTVTNGVYTTPFTSLFNPPFITDWVATSSINSITTLNNLSLPYSQLTGAPLIAGYPFPNNATSTTLTFNGGFLAA